MKYVKVEDVDKLFALSNNLITAYDFSKLPQVDLEPHEYEVELTYVLKTTAFSEDEAVRILEERIRLQEVPYEYSCVTKRD